jgi:Uma2 family endonuclease
MSSASGHPRPDAIHLCIEVADASVGYDRSVKVPLYARSGLCEVWVTDLARSVLEVHRDPSPTGYRNVRRLRRGERIAPLAFADVELDVEALLG